MMGRLNAASVKFDAGRGGLPELTPQDIAGAVGMIKDPLARAVFCATWWDDGAALTSESVFAQLRARLWEEHGRRALEHTRAKSAAAHAKSEVAAAARTSESERYELARLQAAEKRAGAQSWPMSPEIYPRIVKAVLVELRSPRNCPDCSGRGNVMTATGPRDCTRCATTGKVAYANTRRALALGIDESAYRRIWAPVYEWAFSLVNDMEQQAARELKKAIGNPEVVEENSD